jgi:putative isomerase
MNFDIHETPFSRYGSYLAFSHLSGTERRAEGVYLRTVHGDASQPEICRVEMLHAGALIAYTVQASPACLRLESGSGYLEICFADPKTVRFRGVGAGLRLTFQPEGFPFALARPDGWQVNSPARRASYALIPLVGKLVMDAPWDKVRSERIAADCLPDEAGACELALTEFQSVWPGKLAGDSDFTACRHAVEKEFRRWLKTVPAAPAAYAGARELAAYTNWSSVVAPGGHLARPAMFMSKNWMTHVWSWDHCFNAMALTYKNPALAWDQLMLLFDRQDAFGALPDFCDDKHEIWNFCKPPVHGWTLKWMMDRSDFITAKRLKEIYKPLCRWTDWWFNARDDDGDGIPQYHHGNDSGWDNSTAFETGLPLESPDLSAFLVIQMDTLAEVAHRLGKPRAVKKWRKRADDLLARLLAHSWRDDHFVAPRSGDHHVYEADTLFLFLPLLLGKRLPGEVRKKLLDGLKGEGRFLTAHGLATESLSSPSYTPDGYWRGPIWAPSTMIMVEGLAACGEMELARDISRRFCDMAARSGMAENYDALSGAGLRDRAYTWTSSVFLILAHEYLKK